ncbi:unnamed protein product [Amoebophrya sp. A120]|nr:unnamed protein product [Amoebophrya sp. A120]|eukprot:GSA120T00026308001.1
MPSTSLLLLSAAALLHRAAAIRVRAPSGIAVPASGTCANTFGPISVAEEDIDYPYYKESTTYTWSALPPPDAIQLDGNGNPLPVKLHLFTQFENTRRLWPDLYFTPADTESPVATVPARLSIGSAELLEADSSTGTSGIFGDTDHADSEWAEQGWQQRETWPKEKVDFKLQYKPRKSLSFVPKSAIIEGRLETENLKPTFTFEFVERESSPVTGDGWLVYKQVIRYFRSRFLFQHDQNYPMWLVSAKPNYLGELTFVYVEKPPKCSVTHMIKMTLGKAEMEPTPLPALLLSARNRSAI